MEASAGKTAAAYESRKPELEDQIRRMQDALPLYAEQEKNGRHMKLWNISGRL